MFKSSFKCWVLSFKTLLPLGWEKGSQDSKIQVLVLQGFNQGFHHAVDIPDFHATFNSMKDVSMSLGPATP